MEKLYPAGPQSVPEVLTKPSSKYIKQAWLAVASLLFFVMMYFVLTGWFIWTAYRLLDDAANGGQNTLMNFIVGICAAFLALFMLKALFFVKHSGAADTVEVTEKEQPNLFRFLYQLADDAGAPRPARVYLSSRVNAAVFYDLSILNLLFPSRKNLEIGLALINVLTLSEIKAVLAHEFGHFAQRSMAIGSWVYIAQQIATQIIYKRDALDRFLKGLSRFDLRIAWLGWILSLIVWSIRSLLDTLLRLVVLAQRALSRQMEFQADLVAVSLTGSDELVHALHKLQAADDAWGRTLSFADSELRQNRIPHDLFAVQTGIIKKLAHILDDDGFGQTPKNMSASPENHRVFKSSFAQPPQMWSTHPANSDREINAKRLYLAAQHDERSAWLLFDAVDQVKKSVTEKLIGKTEAMPSTAEQTLHALDMWYAVQQYNPRYRGAYLGRSLARHVTHSFELYQEVLQEADIIKALDSLYSEKLSADLNKLRELEEERGILQALRDKVYQAAGGKIVFRGREISRGDLPAAIREVMEEEDQYRQHVLLHDKQCRSAYIAAAKKLGGDWDKYLQGLIDVLHYTEHTLADLRDAQGLFQNVFAVITADGKVTAKELKRLLVVANMLQGVLARIHGQKTTLDLDLLMRTRLKVENWAAMLEEFKLPPATNENIDGWMNVIHGWVESTASVLSTLYGSTLEQLLLIEDKVAMDLRSGLTPVKAPAPSRIPDQYVTLLPGNERKRQTRLGWWDKFQIADGFAAASVRLIVAVLIVGVVLGFGSLTGTTSTLTIYNGLGRMVKVHAGTSEILVPAFSSSQLDFDSAEPIAVDALTLDDKLIEHFNPELKHSSQHYVYNIASASPLIKWIAGYGTAKDSPPTLLGSQRWLAISVDHYFVEPPKSVSTKGGSATRSVLSGAGDANPETVLKYVQNDSERKQMIIAHAQWDESRYPYTSAWQELAR